MKISQLVPRFYPCVGGVELYVYNLVKELSRSGHDVSVITSDIPQVGSYCLDGVEIRRLPVLFTLFDAPFCPSLPIFLGRSKADIMHVHAPSRFFADCASIFHKLRVFSGTPLILTFHLYVETAPSFISAISSLHYRTISRFVFDTCDKVVVPTETYRVLLTKRFGLSLKKVDVIPHGVDLNRFNPNKYNKAEAKKYYGISSEKVVLFVGRLDSQGIGQKGVKYLLEAVPLITKRIESVMFVIAGGGGQLQSLRSLCMKLGLSSYVKFIGEFPYAETPLLISTADVFVLPSLYESFGIALCEALAMGKPVVSTSIRGVTDVVKHGRTGILVDPRSPEQLADAILRILSDDTLAKRLSVEGRRHVEENHNWDFVIQEITRMYERLSG